MPRSGLPPRYLGIVEVDHSCQYSFGNEASVISVGNGLAISQKKVPDETGVLTRVTESPDMPRPLSDPSSPTPRGDSTVAPIWVADGDDSGALARLGLFDQGDLPITTQVPRHLLGRAVA
jgi:hypothetical protein